ncbi:hypothetical protein [Aquamicrobium defluvii]|uniref:Uncharacterized protein n=1 Tax=Aquamicrobium defluvii TaxID=69279 RepID=A0A011UTZ9_9HYPH|nr:hypothetical protein [Aquamicrobium defluvii]EXL09736.1 hypothetical protein BG36_21535 [Aquamicrobium defluvii]EZQ16478.1 hypothetical protein CF98_40175 [Halopseudomonas bauzanensis]TDR36826.1 hypothetical protein DES43_104152 [Aquamicrobium defluvii]
MAGKKKKQAQEGSARVAYLVCALFAFIATIFGSIAACFLLTTQGPQDAAGIFIGFVWLFLSVIVEILVIARAGLFRQTDEPAQPLPEEALERSVFYGKSHEANVSAEAEVRDPKMRFGLTGFMLVSALGLLVVEIMLYRAGRSTMAGFAFSCLPVMFMCYWAALKLHDPPARKRARPAGR